MNEVHTEINRMLEAIEETTTMFYQQKDEVGYLKLDNTLALLIQGIDHLLKLKKENYDININEIEINKTLTNAMGALSKKDTILLSDVLQYDLAELLKQSL